MSIINTTIPSLIGGISQQPDRLKFDGQCKDALNCYGTVKDGLKKRPYARMVKSIIESTDYDENTFIFFIDRTVIERYVGLYSNENGLKVFNLLTGNEAVVTGSDTYLDTGVLDEDDILKALTVADFTFLLNRSKVVNLDVTDSPALATEAMIFIKQGDFEKDYKITIDGTNFTHTTGPSTNANNSDTHKIANQLKNEIDANPAYVVSRTNNIIKVSRVDTADFTITSSDGIGDRGIEIPLAESSPEPARSTGGGSLDCISGRE